MKDQNLFNSYNEYMKKRFGCRVYKVCVDAGFSCPNRDGTKSIGGCIFCDETGSSSRTHKKNTPIKEQVFENILNRKKRYKAKKFIIYFQSYSNTYSDISHLKKLYHEAICLDKDIIGLSIATRADCIDEEKIAMIAQIKDKLDYVNIEYGMQTMHNKTLDIINRAETHEDLLKAVEITKKYNLDWTAHVILGLPKEEKVEIRQTAKELSFLKPTGIKIHLLVAMKNTCLANLYEKNKWTPLEYTQAISLICDFLERIDKGCIIHRIAGNGHPLHTLAPKWAYEKKKHIIEDVKKELTTRQSFQGIYCSS
jgi:radical SAM protein (TIGR01212 family)